MKRTDPRQQELDHAVVERVLAGDPKPRRLTNAEAREICRRLLARGVSTFVIENTYGLKPERYQAGTAEVEVAS